MAIRCDYHLHSVHSGDGSVPMREVVEDAISKGLTHMAFTDHVDFCYPYEKYGTEEVFEINTDAYLYDILRLREEFGDRIKIAYGVELGLQECAFRENSIYVKNNNFDFILGSIHLVNGCDPFYPEFTAGKTDAKAFGEYFDATLANVKKFENFDCLAHLDYVVRYGGAKDMNYRWEEYRETITEILKILIERGKGIEVNTAGIRKNLKDVHPTAEILKLYKTLGGEIVTVGSDAHRKGQVASDINRAEQALKEAGFDYYCVFENRYPEFLKI